MDPSDAINIVENVFRQAIIEALGSAWTHHLTSDELARLSERRTEEAKRRNGAVVDQDLIAYTHLWDLRHIIEKQWASFKPIFKDLARFKVYLKRLEDFRNVPMHSRTLLPFERDLLSGIAGELRNSYTIWRSAKAPDMTWYPVVESISDSLGNELFEGGPSGPKVVSLQTLLAVGDIVKFRCVGWDPQARDLTWRLDFQAPAGGELDVQIGSEVTLTWTVQEAHVADRSLVRIRLHSDGKYHRYSGGWDESISIFYRVAPPSLA
jgi:hypothetical protein